MLKISNLHVSVEDKPVIKGLSLDINKGETHAVMGPNGSGKSTLSQAIIGHPKYEIKTGQITFEGQDILELKPDERARLGIFLAWQYPREIEGVRVLTLLKASYEAFKKAQDKNFKPMLMLHFRQLVLEKTKELGIEESFLNRYVNHGFSGGEKKKMEILQLTLLNPKLAILDEIDSGLDIDALRVVSDGINKFRTEDNAVLMITHYDRLLKQVKPDKVHIMKDGKLVVSGGFEVATQLEEHGYQYFKVNG